MNSWTRLTASVGRGGGCDRPHVDLVRIRLAESINAFTMRMARGATPTCQPVSGDDSGIDASNRAANLVHLHVASFRDSRLAFFVSGLPSTFCCMTRISLDAGFVL